MSLEKSEFMLSAGQTTAAAATIAQFTLPFAASLITVTGFLGTPGSTTTVLDVKKSLAATPQTSTTVFVAPNATKPTFAATTGYTVTTTSQAPAFASGSTPSTNVTSGTDYILPTYPDAQPIAQFAAGDTVQISVGTLGTGAAGALGVSLHFVKR